MKNTNEKCETSKEEKQDVLVLQGKPTGFFTNNHLSMTLEIILTKIKKYD